MQMVRVKMRGKSSRCRKVTSGMGKPYTLKCHVYQSLRAARPSRIKPADWVGRQKDPVSNGRAR